MEIQPKQIDRELLCVNTDKVYDWVILQSNVNTNVLAADLGGLSIDPCGAAVSNLTTECFLTDAAGNRLGPNNVIDVVETKDREDREFVIDATEVILQNVSFQQTLYLVIEFSGLNGTTPFVEQTAPMAIEIPESLFMCAPEGTDLVVRITDIECSVRLNCTGTTLTSVDVSLNICLGVQSIANVTVELFADFCQPRDVLTEQCPTPVIPPQCPVLFPE